MVDDGFLSRRLAWGLICVKPRASYVGKFLDLTDHFVKLDGNANNRIDWREVTATKPRVSSSE